MRRTWTPLRGRAARSGRACATRLLLRPLRTPHQAPRLSFLRLRHALLTVRPPQRPRPSWQAHLAAGAARAGLEAAVVRSARMALQPPLQRAHPATAQRAARRAAQQRLERTAIGGQARHRSCTSMARMSRTPRANCMPRRSACLCAAMRRLWRSAALHACILSWVHAVPPELSCPKSCGGLCAP